MRSSRIAPTNIRDMKLNKENIKTISEFPGIYLIINDINGKKYIGQSINLRKRLIKHCERCCHKRFDNPLYRAILKYGLDNFSFEILSILETKDFANAKKELDKLEFKYISEYDTYNSGYNQTLGGDGGILGYKMTDEQKLHVSTNLKAIANDGRNKIWVYDAKTKLYHLFISSVYAEKYLNIPRNQLRKHGRLIRKRYMSARTEENLRKLVFDYENKKVLHNARFETKIDKTTFMNIYNSYNSVKDRIKQLGICKKTYYNYIHRYLDAV